MPKFRTTSTEYKVTFQNLEVSDLKDILTSLRKLFQSVLDSITEDVKPTDLVRLSIECPELDFPITLPFMRRSLLTVDRLLSEIERVLQSYQEFILDAGLEIHIFHVKNPDGGSRKRCQYVDLEKMLNDKQCFIRIQNDDDLCCARALVTARARLDKHEKWNSIRQGRHIQKELAVNLHREAGVPLGRCGLEDIKGFQTVMVGYQIYVMSKEHFNAIIYSGPEAENKIYLYHHDEHYDVITSMPAFLNRSYYCHACQKGYSNKEKHKCNNACSCCHKIHESTGEWTHCSDCNRYFRGRECFDLHKKATEKGKSTCNSYYKCKECSQTINKNMNKKKHVCGEIYCKTCKDFVEQPHQCYMLPVEEEDSQSTMEEGEEYVEEDGNGQTYIFFDFECTQNDVIECEAGYHPDIEGKCTHCQKSLCGSFEHQPNLCVVHKVCTRCMGEEVTSESTCDQCGKKELVFSGVNTCSDFCKWLFSEENKGAITLCHNFKGYDSFPILRFLYDNGIVPKVIPNGARNMSVEVPACKIRMIDSINFLPTALSKLPDMFGIKELTKGHFPHLYNRSENQSKVLNHLPDVDYYNPDAMKEGDRKSFLKWYHEHKNDGFDLQEELLKYCRSDVDILRRCCLKFRDLFMEVTSSGEGDVGIDPFQQCITIASACNLVFQTKFLKPDTIGIIPAQGYRPEEKHSIKALQWIKYISKAEGHQIEHALNGGERKIGPYRVDGYYEDNDKKVVLEFHGCFWHGCLKCFARTTVNPVNDMTMEDLYEKTLDKKRYLENEGFTYICKWECDFAAEMETKDDIREFLNQLEMVTPLEPRDAFFGGRTEAYNLYKEASETEQIKYYDVTSLYPFINKTGKAPLGHPTIITENFEDIKSYEGLIKCKVLAPRGIDKPILPAKINKKLLFALCQSCAKSQQQEPCEHTTEERAFTGTWVTDELKKAMEKGYTVLHIYEVWHFERVEQYDPVTKRGGLFTDYVNTFLKLKQEASGWPDWCHTEEDKKSYIDQYYKNDGVLLEYGKITKNKGLRALAKLMLNSFWGKFGQRSNMTQIEYVTDPSLYFDMLTSDKQEVVDVKFVTEDMVEMRWKNNDDFVESSGRTNVVVAAYTTAQARLKLYSYLEDLDQRVLYVDTDSIVFTVKGNEYEPPLGDFLGELTDEVPDGQITNFVTGGPKNYAYRVQRRSDNAIHTVCKVRGITLNYKNALDINFDSVREMVTEPTFKKITVTDNQKIMRDQKNCRIVTTRQDKDYKIVFDKRVITQGFQTVPYGY